MAVFVGSSAIALAGGVPRFELPCRPADALAQPPELPLGLEVLLVEDEAINRKIAGRLLERLGCSVAFAEDGLEAIAYRERRLEAGMSEFLAKPLRRDALLEVLRALGFGGDSTIAE